jgi:hypothetical protein
VWGVVKLIFIVCILFGICPASNFGKPTFPLRMTYPSLETFFFNFHLHSLRKSKFQFTVLLPYYKKLTIVLPLETFEDGWKYCFTRQQLLPSGGIVRKTCVDKEALISLTLQLQAHVYLGIIDWCLKLGGCTNSYARRSICVQSEPWVCQFLAA